MAEKGTCFSSAVVWRCSSLSLLENELLIIGPALQLLFSLLLVFTNWSSGKRNHLFLTAEGVFYFSFSLLELLSRVVAAAQRNIAVFSAVDIALAAASFLPLLFYTVFIFTLIRTHILSVLPRRFQNVLKILLLIFIPAILALDEISSFIGVKRTYIVRNPNDMPVIGIGFDPGTNGQLLWSFFTSFTLALLTIFQAMAFSVTFYRVVRVAVDQRRIEQTDSDEAHLFRGVGWIALGLKVGAIETVLGFVSPSFGLQMTRRCLKGLSRALLSIGVAKGFDHAEDFSQLREEMGGGKGFRRSKLLMAIGNPMSETFHRMSPTAATFHSAPHGVAPRELRRSPLGMPAMSELKGSPSAIPRQRVTVHYAGGAPTLHMRFSELDMPSPEIIVKDVKSRPNSTFMDDVAVRKRPLSLPASPDPFPLPDGRDVARHDPFNYHTGSVVSVPDSVTTLAAVRELAAQFPGLPSHPNNRMAQGISYGEESLDSDSVISPRPSLSSARTRASSQLMSVPRPGWQGAALPSPVKEEESDAGSRHHDGTPISYQVGAHPAFTSSYNQPRRQHDRLSSDLSGITPGTGISRFTQPTYDSRPSSFEAEEVRPSSEYIRDSGYMAEVVEKQYPPTRESRQSFGGSEGLWLSRKPMEELAASVMDQQRKSSNAPSESGWRPDSEMSLSSPPSEVSTHYRAPVSRPTVTKTGPQRGSVHLQIHPPPPMGVSGMEIIQTESPSTYNGHNLLHNVLRDDEILEIERRDF